MNWREHFRNSEFGIDYNALATQAKANADRVHVEEKRAVLRRTTAVLGGSALLGGIVWGGTGLIVAPIVIGLGWSLGARLRGFSK